MFTCDCVLQEMFDLFLSLTSTLSLVIAIYLLLFGLFFFCRLFDKLINFGL